MLGSVAFFGSFVPSFLTSTINSKALKCIVGILPPTGLAQGIDYLKEVNSKFVPVTWASASDSVNNYSLGLAITMLLVGVGIQLLPILLSTTASTFIGSSPVYRVISTTHIGPKP